MVKFQKATRLSFFIQKSFYPNRLDILKSAFPDDTLHAIAVKTNSSKDVLSNIANNGCGSEAASLEEVLIAVDAGIPPDKIVFDSPVKTKMEIEYCHRNLPGIIVNANSIQELERYPKDFSGRLGLRINPLVKTAAPKMWDVSKKASKFGVEITNKKNILKAFLNYTQLEGIHIHVGSGINDYSQNVVAIKKVVDLAHEINSLRKSNKIKSEIKWIDIGGGIDFSNTSGEHSPIDFVNQIQEQCQLFDHFKVITEFGKFVHRDNSFVISDIEYILESTDTNHPKTALIHVGADLFLRKVYSDLPIEYPFFIIKPVRKGNKETGMYNIAGPLCFSGDFLYKNIECETIQEGDKFVIQEIGANTLSMWSQHCNRKKPLLIVY